MSHKRAVYPRPTQPTSEVNRLKPAAEDDSDSPFVSKGAGMMWGNAQWISVGLVLGAMLISNRRPYFWPTRKSS